MAAVSLTREFEPMAEYLPPDIDGLTVNAGAYIGTAARKLAAMFPRAQFLCVAASGANFALLKRDFAGHPSIDTLQAAIAAQRGDNVKLLYRGRGQWGFTTVS